MKRKSGARRRIFAFAALVLILGLFSGCAGAATARKLGFEDVHPDAESVFSCAGQIRQTLGENFGEAATQPIDSAVQHRFDGVTDADGLSPLELCSEDRTPETDEEQMEKCSAARPSSGWISAFPSICWKAAGLSRCAAAPSRRMRRNRRRKRNRMQEAPGAAGNFLCSAIKKGACAKAPFFM